MQRSGRSGDRVVASVGGLEHVRQVEQCIRPVVDEVGRFGNRQRLARRKKRKMNNL